MWIICCHNCLPGDLVDCIFKGPYQIFKVGVAFLKTKQGVESFNIDVFNIFLVALEISRTASQEEIPLINVDVVASAQDRGSV